MTEDEAYEAILQHWKASWEPLRPTVPWFTDNEVEGTTAQWARITLVPTVSVQASLGSTVRWMRQGRIAVQLFTALNVGPGALALMIRDVRSVLEGRGIASGDEHVHTVAGSATTPVNEGAWYQATVNVEYWLHDTHEPVESIVAAFTYAASGLDLTFTDASTGPVLSYAWDFGDGETSTEQSPEHTYAEAGTYTVTLTVTDVRGRTSTSEQEIEAIAP